MSGSGRTTGRPVEIFFWRMGEPTKTGARRTLAYNATVSSDFAAVLRSLGVGRYRVEWRDRRRFVVQVETWAVFADGACARVPALPRRRPRAVPPPQHVAHGTPPYAVHAAPVVRDPRPAPRPVRPRRDR